MDFILTVLELFCNRSGMTLEEALKWIEANDRDNKPPWED